VKLPVLDDPAVPRLVVTGHPNHELAILGLVQRLRPRLLFLTDGGGAERVEESRRCLASLGLLDRARFLCWPEKRLYRALLERDRSPFAEIVGEVRAEIEELAPRQVLCESLELYNPLHDITLPIVRAAARGRDGIDGIEVVEFPLISQIPSQTPAGEERYRVQRPPDGRPGVSFRLTAGELAAKVKAREEHYLSLRRQLGPVLDALGPEHMAREIYAPACAAYPEPGEGYALRYEWRGRSLQERGEVAEVITYRGHFLPIAERL
jgi:hypothetical protein